jgi:hypothetical protein
VTLVIAAALPAVGVGAYAASLPECITDRQPPPTVVIIRSAPSGTYGIVVTRREAVAQVETDVTVAYMVHAPSGLPRPKALVVLLPGGEGSAGLNPSYTASIRYNDVLGVIGAVSTRRGLLGPCARCR